MAKQWKRSLSGDDVQAEAEDALEKDISQMSPASNSVAANLDGGVAAVDWASKTPEIVFSGDTPRNGGKAVDVSGSGYLISTSAVSETRFTINIDGTTEVSSARVATNIIFIHRFESSFNVINESGAEKDITTAYVLD